MDEEFIPTDHETRAEEVVGKLKSGRVYQGVKTSYCWLVALMRNCDFCGRRQRVSLRRHATVLPTLRQDCPRGQAHQRRPIKILEQDITPDPGVEGEWESRNKTAMVVAAGDGSEGRAVGRLDRSPAGDDPSDRKCSTIIRVVLERSIFRPNSR